MQSSVPLGPCKFPIGVLVISSCSLFLKSFPHNNFLRGQNQIESYHISTCSRLSSHLENSSRAEEHGCFEGKHLFSMNNNYRGIYKKQSPFGAKICTDICPRTLSVPRSEQFSRKIVSFEEQIMSKEKYPSIFSPQMATIIFIILQIFFAMCAVLKIGEYRYSRISPSFSWGIFGHMMCSGQLRVSKKI